MNRKTAYEQIIAGKLEALPLPDMADAIWARIEAQLDLDLPTDDGPGGDAPNFPTGGFVAGGIGLIVLAALFALFSSSKNNTNNNPTQNNLTPATTTNEIKPAKPPDRIESNTTGINNRVTPVPINIALPQADSSAIATLPYPLAQDSAAAQQSPTIAMPVLVAKGNDTLPPVQKKQRGVSGISDADYRIVPKKDSAGN